MRFHLDEHVAHAIAIALRRRAIDVTTTVQAGLKGKPDQDHIDYGNTERRVTYTNDIDFLIAAADGVEHAGIVYNAPGTRTFRQVIDYLVLMDGCLTQDEMRNKVERVS